MDIQFTLPDMVCGGCVQSVTQALLTSDPKAQIQVDLPSHTVRVASSQPRETLARALASAGFSEAQGAAPG